MTENPTALISAGKYEASSLTTVIQTELRRITNAAKSLSPQRMTLVLLCTFLITTAVFYSLSSGTKREVYSNLQDQDRASIIEILEKENIAYEIDTETGKLSVDENEYYKARMVIASAGALTPITGTEVIAGMPLGTSRVLESEYIRKALEYELSQSILQITVVETARVHLAMPKKTAFITEELPAGASVMVKTKNGQSLSPQQVDGIANLIAGSIPNLDKERVKIVDHAGNLLTRQQSLLAASLQAQQLLETKIQDQIARILLPIFGSDGFQVEVQVSLDPTLSSSATETFADEGSLRREMFSEQLERRRLSDAGVPGVLTNNVQDIAGESSEVGRSSDFVAGGSGAKSSNREFELGRTISVRTVESGAIERISVGVVLDADKSTNAGTLNRTQIQELVSAVAGIVGS